MKPGTVFRLNKNGVVLELVKTEGAAGIFRDFISGKIVIYGMDALEHCSITILNEGGAKDGEQ